MAKKLKKFCRITLFIEQDDKKFADAIDHVCMFGPFTPGRREKGVTFLYPGSKYRNEICNAVYGSDPETANAMIRACIISGYYPSASEFADKGYVVNRMSQMVKVKSTSGNTVTFANGAKATLNKKFKGMGVGRDNVQRLVVYDLEGKIDIDNEYVSNQKSSARSESQNSTDADNPPDITDIADPEASGKYEEFYGEYGENISGAAEVVTTTGGYDYSDGDFNRDKFWRGVFEAYINKFFQRPYGELQDKFPNPFLEKLVSLLRYMEAFFSSELDNILELVDYGPHMGLYLLIEPYKSDNYVLEDYVLNSWKKDGYPKISNPNTEFKNILDILMKKRLNSKRIFAINEKVRKKLFSSEYCTPWKLSKQIVTEYKDYQKNDISNENDHLYKVYKKSPLLKIQQDEARFIMQNEFMDIEDRRVEELQCGLLNRGELRNIFKKIKLSHHLTKEKEDQLFIGQGLRYKETNIKGVWFDGPFAFVRSTDLIYHAVDLSTTNSLPGLNDDKDNTPNYRGLVNMYKRRYEHIDKHYENRSTSKQALLVQLASLIRNPNTSVEQLESMKKSIESRLSDIEK